MPEIDPTEPLEPWTGYAKLDPAARREQYQSKHDSARKTGDQAYALALAAAVNNYELLRRAAPTLEHDEDARAQARNLHDDAGSWKPN
jgi:hypothetical protein